MVREARPADAAAITDLLQGIYREQDFFVGAAAAPRNVLRSRLEHAGCDDSLYLVAVPEGVGDEALGWLELHRHGALRLRHVATLTLAVRSSARRRGIGRALLRRSYEWCDEVGVLKISLNVRESNRGAIALYLSEGFAFEGRERDAVRLGPLGELAEARQGDASARYEDNLLMARFMSGASLE